MTVLVTGSSGHLGDALVRTLRGQKVPVRGVDIKASPTTDVVGSITDRDVVASCFAGVEAVLHTATLHKPHVATHSRQEFVDTNISGTLNLLEEARAHGVRKFVFTSTTSTFGRALVPPPGEPTGWITEDVVPIPKNIYGVTKLAAEKMCQLFASKFGVPSLVLRTSRFFPEEDDSRDARSRFSDENLKANEFLHRRADLEDVVSAHLCALEKVEEIGFDTFIISATTPFTEEHLADLRSDAVTVLADLFPALQPVYERLDWTMFDGFDRVYVNDKARRLLDWSPKHDFGSVLRRVGKGGSVLSDIHTAVGSKGYHDQVFKDGPFPVED
ncbi:MAG: NAD(P)-dependent oxidoreductase [Pseudomonadota bacterium]